MISVRKANVRDATASAHVHVQSWQTIYAGIAQDEYLASLLPTQGDESASVRQLLSVEPWPFPCHSHRSDLSRLAVEAERRNLRCAFPSNNCRMPLDLSFARNLPVTRRCDCFPHARDWEGTGRHLIANSVDRPSCGINDRSRSTRST
jgi:hypothetical protein